MKCLAVGAIVAVLVGVVYPSSAEERQPPQPLTVAENAKVYERLPFDESDDFENASRGFIALPESLTICKDNVPSSGGSCDFVVWDLAQYDSFINSAPQISSIEHSAPDSVNPSLWRNAQLNMKYGLFRVASDCPGGGYLPGEDAHGNQICLEESEVGIYQVRGLDLSNITFIRGKTGWVVMDPLVSPETARAALELIQARSLFMAPVVAVVYSHSHVDHYGGVRGLFAGEAEIQAAIIVAPEGFTEHAVSENVIAGNAMARRAAYMYGPSLPKDELGSVSAGLGQTTSSGVAGLILPTVYISEKDESPVDEDGGALESLPGKMIYVGSGQYLIDGVKMEFQMTPGTEAPAEMNTWFEDLSALWMAENATNTMHNLLTLRGAQVRNAYTWVKYLNETIEKWGDDVLVKFQSHHWPLWADAETDNANIVEYLKMQRDIYKFIHDQTVRLMNNGYTGEEISELIKLPSSLERNWSTRGYYGTLRHNSRAVYQYYMGWYDGHPSDLNNLPPEDVAVRYMEYMEVPGNSVYDRAEADFLRADDVDDYRWVAEVMKHAVFAANPADADYQKKRLLLAKALEQLGYLAESGPWRSVYLQGAADLRSDAPGVSPGASATPDTLKAMPPEMVFDFMAVHLCSDLEPLDGSDCKVSAEGAKLIVDVEITNGVGKYRLMLENSVLNYSHGPAAGAADVAVRMNLDQLHNMILPESEQGDLPPVDIVGGEKDVWDRFVSMFDLEDNILFNIVTP